MKKFWTREFWSKGRCTHMADFLRAVALGVLVYFGFQTQHFQIWSMAGSGVMAGLLELLALVIINGDIKESGK